MNFLIITFLIHSVYSASFYADDWTCKLSHFPPKPDSQCCGVDSTNSNRIVGGKDTLINQYPWMALLEYTDKVGSSNISYTLCGGFLVSGKYVVTAAHCFTNERVKLVNVILGAHENIFDEQFPDRNSVSYRTGIRVPVEKVTIHPGFSSDGNMWNDVALIKLKDMVKYSESVRPICLPETDISLNSPKNVRLYSAGWGVSQQILNKEGKYNELHAYVKKHVDLPLKPLKECDKYGSTLRNTIQVCAGGETGKDVCMGDSGGPLMYEDDGIYQAVGIVSYGPSKPCGRTSYPGVYTKVFAFKPWIMKHIRADSRKQKRIPRKYLSPIRQMSY